MSKINFVLRHYFFEKISKGRIIMARTAISDWEYKELKDAIAGKFQNIADYKNFARSQKINDKKLPVSPDLYFKKTGTWVSFPDFLGVEKFSKRRSSATTNTANAAPKTAAKATIPVRKKVLLEEKGQEPTVASAAVEPDATVYSKFVFDKSKPEYAGFPSDINFGFTESVATCDMLYKNSAEELEIAFSMIKSDSFPDLKFIIFAENKEEFEANKDEFFRMAITGMPVEFDDGTPVHSFDLEDGQLNEYIVDLKDQTVRTLTE